MKLVHLDSGREMRGGQYQALELMRGLELRHHELVLLARPGSPLFDRAAEAGLFVKPLSLSNLVEYSREADLVHAHDARSHTMCALASRAPFVVSRRVAFPVKQTFASRWKYSRSQHFLAVSRYVAEELERAGVDRYRITVVYDGVSPPASVEPFPRRAAGPVVAPAGADPMKGEDLLRASGLPVTFSNFLPDDLARASAFVYISRSEGLGSAALLAMAYGVPVVASRTGGLTEIVEHEITGLLTGNSPEEIASSVRRLKDDPPLAMRLSSAGREQVLSCFTTEHMIARTLEAYAKVPA